MDPQRSTSALDTSCPRCGYDQTGVIETWRESCPLTGTCSECGLEFTWDDVLSPEKRLEKWYIESRGNFFRTWFGTLRRAPLAPTVWKRLPLATIWRPVRLYLMLLLTVAVCNVLLAIFSLTIDYHNARLWGGFVLRQSAAPDIIINKRGFEVDPLNSVITLVFPPAAVSALRGSYTEWMVTPAMHFALGLPLLVSAGFFLLPDSVSRCKVRPRHLIRCGVLALCTSYLALSIYTVAFMLDAVEYEWHFPVDITACGVIFAWSVWYWFVAVRYYLRMPHAFAVSALLHTAAALAIGVSPTVVLTLGRELFMRLHAV